MPNNTSNLIEEPSLSLAWGKAFLAAMESSQTNPAPLVVSVTEFENGLPPEDSRIRAALDQLLAAHKKNSCSVSAMIIFPYQQWLKKGLFGGICGSIDGQGRWAEADPSVGADRRSPPE